MSYISEPNTTRPNDVKSREQSSMLVLMIAAVMGGTALAQEGPLFNAGVAHMFQALAENIYEELSGKNVSDCGELLTKISFLRGGMKQLMSMAEKSTARAFDTIKPIVEQIMKEGKPQFEKIHFSDNELMERFSWNSTQIGEFRSYHSDIGTMLQRLHDICRKYDFMIRR